MNFDTLLHDIGVIAKATRTAVGRSLDRMLTLRNWLIGAYIVEYEQNGEDRASYGERLISKLAQELGEKWGQKGLGARNLHNCRRIALTWPGLETASPTPRPVKCLLSATL